VLHFSAQILLGIKFNHLKEETLNKAQLLLQGKEAWQRKLCPNWHRKLLKFILAGQCVYLKKLHNINY